MTDCQLLIKNDGIIYEPVIAGPVTWTTSRAGSPGKLTFTVVNDNKPGDMKINIQEGNQVTFRYKGQEVFTGFLFTKSRTKDQMIQVTAYDQLRYLKNKHPYVYTDKTTTQLLREIAQDFLLTVGDCDETSYPVSKREEDSSLFDIILNSLDETITATKKMYVLYDDFGKIVLKDAANLKVDTLVTENTAEDFDYETSIDSDTYNRVLIVYDNKETGEQIKVKADSADNINKWGLLQLFEKAESEEEARQKAQGLLKLYNTKKRSLKVSGALGNVQARAGFSVPVALTLGDVNANSYLLIEDATHVFEDGHHKMDLTLRGDVFH